MFSVTVLEEVLEKSLDCEGASARERRHNILRQQAGDLTGLQGFLQSMPFPAF
jgi:hypothetical protein